MVHYPSTGRGICNKSASIKRLFEFEGFSIKTIVSLRQYIEISWASEPLSVGHLIRQRLCGLWIFNLADCVCVGRGLSVSELTGQSLGF